MEHSDRPLLEPGELDTSKPSPARMYDAYLGGKDNYAVDREAVEKIRLQWPEIVGWAHVNRQFLVRTVRYLAEECGIRQFLDLGSGLPTQQNVHQVAQAVDPACRVVYVDNQPEVLTYSRALLTHATNTTFIRQDLRDPDAILNDPKVRGLLDLGQPVAIMLVAVLHFLTNEDDPYGVVQTLRAAMAPGSYLAISHAAPSDPGQVEQMHDFYQRSSSVSGALRTQEQVQPFFEGLDLVEPGLVDARQWRPWLGSTAVPEVPPGTMWILAGVGHKRGTT